MKKSTTKMNGDASERNAERPTVLDESVVQVLRQQVTQVRLGRPLKEGKLEHFRRALDMKNFPDFVRLLKDRLDCDMFTTLQEIESMEEAILNDDHVELIAQCCMILHFWERESSQDDTPIPDLRNNQSWLFGHCRSMEEIAFLRSRLGFIRQHVSFVQISINRSLLAAVRNLFEEDPDQSKWQGLLLVFREAGPVCNHILFSYLNRVIHDERFEVPKAAATLFLSYVSDVIYTLSLLRAEGIQRSAVSRRIIFRLLELGASLMVSRENHHVLFRSLMNRMRTDRNSWWLEVDYLKAVPRATALNRIFTHRWDHDFIDQIALRTCCGLDAFLSISNRFQSEKVPRLACLAARRLPESALNELGPRLRFLASKHKSQILQSDSDDDSP